MKSHQDIIDKTGVWLINTGDFRYAHPTREGVFLEPGVRTKIDMDDYLKSQSAVIMPEGDAEAKADDDQAQADADAAAAQAQADAAAADAAKGKK